MFEDIWGRAAEIAEPLRVFTALTDSGLTGFWTGNASRSVGTKTKGLEAVEAVAQFAHTVL